MAEKKFLDFMDRFDGGGMGKSGDKFEGGGLLSLLGNIFATPRGSEDRAKEEALAGLLGNTRPNMRPTVGSGNGLTNSTSPEPTPALAQSPLEMFGGQQPAPYSPTMQGSGMTPANNYVPSEVTFAPSVPPEFTMPDGSSIDRAAPMQDPYNNSVDNSYQRFTEELFELFGPEVAPSYIGTGAGEMLYNDYVKNGYRFPVN